MSIETLKHLVPPPMAPTYGGCAEDWLELEGNLEFKFPQDFKDLLRTYGSGQFARFFGVANPFCMSRNGPTYRQWVAQRLAGIENAKKNYPKAAVPFASYPNTTGLYPWGFTDNGETLCWLRKLKATVWPIVCLSVGCTNEFDTFEVSTTEFISNWLRGTAVPSFTPPDFFPLRKPVFVPFGTGDLITQRPQD